VPAGTFCSTPETLLFDDGVKDGVKLSPEDKGIDGLLYAEMDG
jgi:hypothetical protein